MVSILGQHLSRCRAKRLKVVKHSKAFICFVSLIFLEYKRADNVVTVFKQVDNKNSKKQDMP